MNVYKIGGGEELNIDAFVDDLATVSEPKILVHGGNQELTDLQTQLGHPPRMVQSVDGQSSRFTDRETMEYFWMVYCGRVNKYIVERLQKRGVNAIGLSGMDGRLAVGKRRDRIKVLENGKQKILAGDYAGSVEMINISLLTFLMDHGYTPVITPPALSEQGDAINVDGDKLAARIAIQMQASGLFYFFAAPGLLRDRDDEASLIREVKLAEVDLVMAHAGGRMKKKVLAARWALEGGVTEVRLGDGRTATPVQDLMAGKGTIFIR
ncbi:acetylglutamate kinase [Candidatus Wirthbacteria bacterium CG2_30_54_11]|uniref:Acetylglutamate kinase n=1 Tax=Candidatus Wirthbacteria bacterium CG2_30_54_11 TaxID=1817892 RepID=A0A1J5IHY3_9BACT|nr:MAG: acetylglutamate kinase [Candidatus Wirthbacteria bacterium CG2_30_54_11]